MNPTPTSNFSPDPDEELVEIRATRHRISASFGHDPYRLVAHLMELQKEHLDRLVPAPESQVERDPVRS
jgi:hypothetical protein